MKQKEFLTAEWRKLIMANYIVDPSVLKEYLPAKTELDHFNNACYVSLVGFMFREVRVKGLKIPGHNNFPEVNLRFYVRHFDTENKEWKRGVVFISEIVPKPAISFIANTLYKENYSTLPMQHRWETTNDELLVSYSWKKKNHWNKLEVKAHHVPGPLIKDSEEEFITEHFWGYSVIAKDKTAEYHVTHPRWDIYKVKGYDIDCDFGALYGNNFSLLEKEKPVSVFLAEGSPITVFSKKVL
jgi:uncharacterized protein YqjF (DUF2071 family)